MKRSTRQVFVAMAFYSAAMVFSTALRQAAGDEATATPDVTRPAATAGPAWDTRSDTWAAIDGLGRPVAEHQQTGPPRPGKFVGVFYFIEHGSVGATESGQPIQTVYDTTKILAANPTRPPWGPANAAHYWGQPLLGYYLIDDEYVIRRHAQMLADADVDVIFFDVTNGYTFPEVYLKLCKIYRDIRRHGGPTPQVAFVLNADVVTGEQCIARPFRKLYDEFYSKRLYPELWFYWKGKPLVLANPMEVDASLRGFFTFRQSWAGTKGRTWFADGKDKWPWVDRTPQGYGWHENRDKPEQISVSVAVTAVDVPIGRSFHNGREPPASECRPELGLHFAEQWKRALQVDPEFVFITQWNEWIAGRGVARKGGSWINMKFAWTTIREGDTFFVDEYNQEFSRDIEPMTGGHGDNYYWQMVDGIRRFKGTRPPAQPSAPTTISLANGFDQWKEVEPEYRDDVGDVVHRHHPVYGAAGPCVNTTGRNDLKLAKVARDSQHVWFYVQTVDPITPPAGPFWMTLFLRVEDQPGAAWEDFQYMAQSTGDKTYRLSKCMGAGKWRDLGELSALLKGNELVVQIPRRLLGLVEGHDDLNIGFKWADNMQTLSPLEWLVNGDTAPNGRFRYRYHADAHEKAK